MSRKTVTIVCTSAFMHGGDMVVPGDTLDHAPMAEVVDLARRGKAKMPADATDAAGNQSDDIDLEKMTVEQLKSLAEECGVEGHASMKKADLIAAIEAIEDGAE